LIDIRHALGLEIGYEPGSGLAQFFFTPQVVKAYHKIGIVVGGLSSLSHQPLA
jgi:hypothetical protein